MLKKTLTTIVMLLVVSSIFTFRLVGTETGTKITRDVNDFVRVLVINENAGAGAQAGFKAMNDASDSLLIYIESAVAGSDVWFETTGGNVIFNVPSTQHYEYRVNDVKIMKLSGSGIADATWAGNTIAVNYGGTGASSFTDGGILLGSGTDAVTAMSVLGDGAIVVGDGTTDPVTLTAFTSSTGFLKHESGGLEANVSAYNGLVAISGGAASEIDSKSELEAQIADVADFAEADGDTYTNDHVWWGANIASFNGTPNGHSIGEAFNFDGKTIDDYKTRLIISDPTINREIKLQDHSGFVVLDVTACYDLEGTNLSITNGVLNATISSGDVSVGAANYLYLWATGNTQNDEADNWRCSVGTNDLKWEYYTGTSWVEKEVKTP